MSSLTPGTVVPEATQRLLPHVAPVVGAPSTEAEAAATDAGRKTRRDELEGRRVAEAEGAETFVVMARRTYDTVTLDTSSALQAPFDLTTANMNDPAHSCSHSLSLEFVRQHWYLRIRMWAARSVDVTSHKGALATSELLSVAPAEFEVPLHVYAADGHRREALGPTVWAC
jgi:hypothetical protein